MYSLDINEPGADFESLHRQRKDFRFVKTDVTKKESVDKAIEEIYRKEGRLDGFIANAGMTKHQPALDFSEEQLHQLFELNVCRERTTEFQHTITDHLRFLVPIIAQPA